MADAAFNPVLLDIPSHVDTERLQLRAPRPGDGPTVHASILETLVDLRRYPASMPWALQEQTVESAEEYVRRGAANWILRADFPLLAFDRVSGAHVGNVGLHRFNWATRVFEIGWWCRTRFQGQGFITEAARGLTAFAFAQLGARRVWCGADDENVRSWRVAERLGFQHEGTLRSERCDPDGTRRTMRIYASTR
jgi:RimJ/RimL family protein N-acetyltransferase